MEEDYFLNTWTKYMAPTFIDSTGKKQDLTYDNRLTSIAQMNMDRVQTLYRDKSGIQREINLNNLTAEFILLNAYYFNDLRVDSGAQFEPDYRYP